MDLAMSRNIREQPVEEWHPSAAKNKIVLLELLSYGPLRYDELAEKLSGKVSCVTLAKTLDELEKEGSILRNQKSRKYVEYAPNPKHPTVQGVLPAIAETIFYHIRKMKEGGWLPVEYALEKIHEAHGKTRKKLIRFATQCEMYDLAFEVVQAVIISALRQVDPSKVTGPPPLLETLFEEKILAYSKKARETLAELAKLDNDGFLLTANQWLSRRWQEAAGKGAQPFIETATHHHLLTTTRPVLATRNAKEKEGMKELQQALTRNWSIA
jgi:DNA-binding HxlR family transcriptional regulator